LPSDTRSSRGRVDRRGLTVDRRSQEDATVE
jgi:hypothetical protein